jgi:hypothetical protein
MTPRNESDLPSQAAAAVTSLLADLGKVGDTTTKGAPRTVPLFFPNGIELIEVVVQLGTAPQVHVTVAGKDGIKKGVVKSEGGSYALGESEVP